MFKVTDALFPEMISSTLRMISNNKVNSKRIKNDYNKVCKKEYKDILISYIIIDR